MSTTGPEVRIGDSDREAAIAALGEHYAAGRLDKDEFDERAERVWAARTDASIRPLFADLPQPHPRRHVQARSQPSAVGRFPAPPRKAVPRRRLPILPLLLCALAAVILLGSVWPIFLVVGGLWFLTRSCGRQRSTADWAGGCGPRSSTG